MTKKAIIIEKYLRTFSRIRAIMRFRIIGVILSVQTWTHLQGCWSFINIEYVEEQNS
jgi:uncharacterized membrane protein YoaT (DUF817 family)